MTLEELLVKIKVENKQAVKGLSDAKRAAEQTEGQFGKLREGLKTLKAQMKSKANGSYAKGISKGYRDAQKSLESLIKKQEAMRRHNMATPQYKRLASDVAKAERALDELVERQIAWAEAGYDVNSGPFQALDEQIEAARVKLERLHEKQKEWARGGYTKDESEAWKNVEAKIAEARAEVSRYERILAGVGAGNPVVQRIAKIVSSVRRAGAGIKNFGVKSAHAIKGVVSWIGKMGRGVGTVLSKIPLLNRIPSIFKRMKKGMFMGAGLRSMIRLGATGFLIFKAFSMAKEGMQNLAQYSGQTNSDISMLMGSLNTLKNALATAFTPILTAVAPALNYLIQLLVKAATAVAHFTAAFTGKSTVVVAKQQTADYAASLGDAADAAGSANDAAKEYQKTLLGFDQMNVLNDADKSSGSGGSGGGAGAGGFGDMFETVEVGSGASNLADRIKEAWKNADFTDLGRDLGNKIAEELNKIPWEKLQNIAYKLGKSIATGFNGLNDSEFWGSLGHAVAESLNTVLTGIEGFVFNFKWTKAGRALADGINHLFLDFDWVKLGKTFSRGAKGIFEALKGLFDDIKWEEIGKSVMSAITHVDWVGIIVSGIKAAGSLATGILKFLKGAFGEAVEGLKRWISSGEIWKDLGSLGSATLQITADVIGAAWDLLTDIINGIADIVVTLVPEIAKKAKELWKKITGGEIKLSVLLDLVYKKLAPGSGVFSKFMQGTFTGGGATGPGLVASPLQAGVNWGVGKIVDKIFGVIRGTDKEVGEINKNTKRERKKSDYVPRQLSVIDAFKKPITGALFSSLVGAGSQFKIKTMAELTSIKDKIPVGKKNVGNMLAMLSRKNETFSKTTGNMIASLGSKSEGFAHTSNNMTASLGSKSEGFSHWTDQMSAWITGKSEGFSHWTDKMSAWITGKSEGFDHWTDKMSAWLKYKGEYFDHWTDAMTAYINSISFGSRAKQIILNATTKASGGLYRNGRWQPITAAASGGSFNTGQMFIAREAGPELVGKIGTGSTVMNNDQIVASVSAGVAKGAYEAFVSAFRDTGGNSPQVVLEGDAAKMFRVMQRQAVQYMNSTGQAPFPV